MEILENIFHHLKKKWKDCDSSFFLKHAAKELYNRNGKIIHIDIVVITEIPKISTYSCKMKRNISKLLGINVSKISIKGKSNEGIGSIGRKEGIAVMTNSTLSFKELNEFNFYKLNFFLIKFALLYPIGKIPFAQGIFASLVTLIFSYYF